MEKMNKKEETAMKSAKILTIFLILLIILPIVPINKANAEVETIRFYDQNLYNEIKESLDKKEIEYTCNDTNFDITVDASQVEYLYLYRGKYNSLTGLEHFTNLTELYISDYAMTDEQKELIGNNLTKLEKLTLVQIKGDLNAFGKLTNLKSLIIRNGQALDNIEPLKNLVNLEELSIEFKTIVDISPIKDLVKLKKLCLIGNRVSDLTPLKKLINLEELDLSNNSILSNIEPIGNLTNLKKLYLDTNRIKNVDALKPLKSLIRLTLDWNNITDISSLEDMKELEYFSATNNQINSIDALKNATKLEALYLANNKVSDISMLDKHTNLKYLSLSKNCISDISALDNLSEDISLAVHEQTFEVEVPISGNNMNISMELPQIFTEVLDPTSRFNFANMTNKIAPWENFNPADYSTDKIVVSDENKAEIDGFNINFKNVSVGDTVELEITDGYSQEYGNTKSHVTYKFVEPKAILGDVNDDGKINQKDAKLVLKAFAGKTELTENQTLAADVNKDEKINQKDAKLILKYFAGKITGF